VDQRLSDVFRRGGSRRLKFYRLTAEGKDALDRYREVVRCPLNGATSKVDLELLQQGREIGIRAGRRVAGGGEALGMVA